MVQRRIILSPPFGYGCADGDSVTMQDGSTHPTKVLLFQDPSSGDVVEVVMPLPDVEKLMAQLRGGVAVAPASILDRINNGRHG